MSEIAFLLDEHIPLRIKSELLRQEPRMRIYAIGEPPAPAKGTPDGDVLLWAEAHTCMLVTNNRATMPVHLARHISQGRHVPGIIQLPRRLGISAVLDDLLLIWSVILPTEFQDQIIYLPLHD